MSEPFSIPPPPAGSRITIASSRHGYRITLFQPTLFVVRFGTALFLGFWLCGWGMGEVFAFRNLFNSETLSGASYFLVIWLVVWTYGGIMAIAYIYRLLRPPRPEQIILRAGQLSYFPGWLNFYPQAVMAKGANVLPPPSLRLLFRPPSPEILPKEAITGILTDFTDQRPRLMIEIGARRLEIGLALTEPEREWLVQVMNTWYTAPTSILD